MKDRKPTIAHPGIAAPKGIPTLVARYQRKKMYNMFLAESKIMDDDTIVDIGATSDQDYESSNYLEAWYPRKENITAVGIDDASFLEKMYPGLTFIRANGLNLPFDDNSFDMVHSSAVLEHVGNIENQKRLISECSRVARKLIFMTTPNRWFPVEFHTVLPLLHWLPKSTHRKILFKLNMEFFASEDNLNLMSHKELLEISNKISKFDMTISSAKLVGWSSNLILIGKTRST